MLLWLDSRWSRRVSIRAAMSVSRCPRCATYSRVSCLRLSFSACPFTRSLQSFASPSTLWKHISIWPVLRCGVGGLPIHSSKRASLVWFLCVMMSSSFCCFWRKRIVGQLRMGSEPIVQAGFRQISVVVFTSIHLDAVATNWAESSQLHTPIPSRRQEILT